MEYSEFVESNYFSNMLNISRENLVFLLRVKFRSSSEYFKLTDRFRLKWNQCFFLMNVK